MQTYEKAFAVVRVDKFLNDDVDIANKIKVKAVFRNEKQAQTEVERLNNLDTANGCLYFHQQTRLF